MNTKSTKKDIDQIVNDLYELLISCDVDTLAELYVHAFDNVKSCKYKPEDDYTSEHFEVVTVFEDYQITKNKQEFWQKEGVDNKCKIQFLED